MTPVAVAVGAEDVLEVVKDTEEVVVIIMLDVEVGKVELVVVAGVLIHEHPLASVSIVC